MLVSKLNQNIMKAFIYLSLIFFLSFIDSTLKSQNISKQKHQMRVNLIVDTSCAKCQLGKTSDETCLLAVEINSEIYYVEGTTIDDHGDAHGSDGFCNVIRKAQVEGIVNENTFLLDKFRLLKYRPKKKLYSN